MKHSLRFYIPIIIGIFITSYGCNSGQSATEKSSNDTLVQSESAESKPEVKNTLDSAEYDRLIQLMANNDTTGLWPVKGPYPLPGAILPFHRIIAYYGNLYSTRMGILGEIPKYEMFAKLKGEVASWQAADSSIPAIPALHYVAVTAQGAPGTGAKHRLRMPNHQIDTIVSWAKEIDALVFLDIQVGHSSLQEEVPALDNFLKMPQVHLGIDPEFSMKTGHVPGKKIGTFDAADINVVIDHLAKLVKENNLPPKILVVHRFTQGMVTNYKNIKNVPEVQVVMDMDGWGNKVLKRSTWLRYIYREPVEFAGFKLFYKHDTKTGADQLYSPEELLKFTPKPIYIQYQ
ncbi:MAG: hypothetical protein ABIN48_14100 [Ginsengibacter sp.]